MIEINYRYEITVTYIDNVNEAFNPSFLGSQFIDRRYVTNSIFWQDELKTYIENMFKKYGCVACMVSVLDNESMKDNDISEYTVWQDTHNRYLILKPFNKYI